MPGYKKDFEIMRIVLQELCDLSSFCWRNEKNLYGDDVNDVTMANYYSLIYTKPGMDSEKLISLWKAKSRDLRLDFENPIYLPPLTKNSEFIPFLYLACDLGCSPPKTSLRVGMIRYIDGVAQGLGLRFEIGHPDSDHDYFHMQLTTSLYKDQPIPGCPDWIPQIYPCIPIPARCPVSLIFMMLISFYGKKISNSMISDLDIDGKYKEPLKCLGSWEIIH